MDRTFKRSGFCSSYWYSLFVIIAALEKQYPLFGSSITT